MPIERLPESLQTLYAELLDQVLRADAEAAATGLPLDLTRFRGQLRA